MCCLLINQVPVTPLLCRETFRGAAEGGELGWRCRGGNHGDSRVMPGRSKAKPAGAAGSSWLPHAAPLHASAEGMKCSSSVFQSTREKVSRKIIWKVCLTLEQAFIFGKILVTLQGSIACFPAWPAPQGTHPGHHPRDCFRDAWGSEGDNVVPPGLQFSQGCWHRDAGTRDAPGQGSKAKMKRLELAGSGGKKTARGSGMEGAPGRRQGFLPRCNELPAAVRAGAAAGRDICSRAGALVHPRR